MIKYRDIEYRDTFSRYVSWHKISGIAQHYTVMTSWECCNVCVGSGGREYVPVSCTRPCHYSAYRHDTALPGGHAVCVIRPKSSTGCPVKLFAVTISSDTDDLSRAHAAHCDWLGASWQAAVIGRRGPGRHHHCCNKIKHT